MGSQPHSIARTHFLTIDASEKSGTNDLTFSADKSGAKDQGEVSCAIQQKPKTTLREIQHNQPHLPSWNLPTWG
ncbi:hypothetical protein CNECB9_3760078 [Cupriavidus necator]|uniref:Uncharacterized protein n=1 Tax=Cupriavidus necator TaxID=106590 RepID=A0A1K0JDT3_CUPNE|nr:hypothetical protein CNECB9_3760078 [Cupriavidus necator]